MGGFLVSVKEGYKELLKMPKRKATKSFSDTYIRGEEYPSLVQIWDNDDDAIFDATAEAIAMAVDIVIKLDGPALKELG